MKIGNNPFARPWVVIALGIMASTGALAKDKAAPDKATEIDPKTRKEIEESERRFGKAIEKRDTAALSEILADYYAESIGDSERAVSKSGAISRARAGKLAFYKIERDRRLSVSADTYTVEGKAKEKSDLEPDQEIEGKWVTVRRIWIKKNGQWLLVAQMRGTGEEDSKEKDEHSTK